jgi:polysaccharide pyruvyl transferase WcaK-like protein
MSRKIGIVTLNGYFNYGNRLQNYALEQAINSIGYEAETILVDSNYLTDLRTESKKTNIPKRLKNKSVLDIADRLIHKLHALIFRKKHSKRKSNRYQQFFEFSKRNLHETEFTLKESNLTKEFEESYSCFVVGSDQVWNPHFTSASPIYFLRFTEKAKRVAYAPSFSVPHIEEQYLSRYKEWIRDFNKLSVREEDGARLIEELTGLEVPVLVDPTLLLTKQQWLDISQEAPKKPKQKYIATYFLGGVPIEHRSWLKQYAKNNNYKIINLADVRDNKAYETGPAEFISYVNDCSLFLTDSFHGAVFSILFKKPFIAYKRRGGESMYSRIDTLLDRFSLNERKIENMNLEESVFEINYDHVDAILEIERKRSMDFLRDSFKSIEQVEPEQVKVGFDDADEVITAEILEHASVGDNKEFSESTSRPGESKDIMLSAYLDNNLGDDLMIKLLAKRFPQHLFYLYTDLSVIKNTFKDVNNMIIQDSADWKKGLDSADAFISIGGSIFQVSTWRQKVRRLQKIFRLIRLRRHKIKIITIGSNLGPYASNIGVKLTEWELRKNDLITVRDKASLNMLDDFRRVKNYFYADDLVYNLFDFMEERKTEKEGLGISVYRSIRTPENNFENYAFLANLVDKYVRKTNRGVKLFAFDSERENDLSAAHHIYNLSEEKHNVEIVPYLGDEHGFLAKFKACERMIAIRFHSAVLADIYKIPFLPIVYSNKMSNFLMDRGYEGITYDTDALNKEIDVDSLVDEIICGKNLFCDFLDKEHSAAVHFEELDKILNSL